jgi:predicted nucleotidyltransferase component of viral defense system
MRNEEIKNLPASIQNRLLTQARSSGRPFNELLQYYTIERFLYRLTQSRFADRFVLKGAALFRAWGLATFRPTRDIDLLGYTRNDVENLVSIIQEVCGQDVQPDGIFFDAKTVHGERIKENSDYEGVRIRFGGTLGKARLHLQIDIGFADIITPGTKIVAYPVILKMPAPKMQGYPPETVVSEKLHAMVFHGSVNSRMKDFFDVWVLSQQSEFKGPILQKAIQQTFHQRKTAIPSDEPTAFSAQFAHDKQAQWIAFLKGSEIQDAPEQFESVITILRNFILPIFQSLNAGQPLEMKWKPCGPWK